MSFLFQIICNDLLLRVSSWQNKNIMQIRARNLLQRTIKSIAPGAVSSQVVIELSNGVEVAPDYHERFGGTLESGDGQNGLRRRQSERRDDCD